MTIAYDYTSSGSPGTGNISWTHTPVGTPRGVLVFVMQYNNGTDQVTGVTYGGVTMPETTSSALLKTGGEAMGVYCYFLGTAIPTGAQTVVVTVSDSSMKAAVCFTVTASTDTAIQETDGSINSNSIASPTTTLALDGRNAFCAIGFVSGVANVASITPRTGWTSSYEYDAGNEQLAAYRYNTISTADVTAGWTQSADDALAIAVAIRELYVSLVLDPAVLTGQPIPIADVIAPVAQTTIVLETAALWFSSSRRREIDVEPAQLTATPIPLAVDAPITIALSTATIAFDANSLAVDAPVNRILDTAILTGTGISLGVDVPATRVMDTATITATGIPLTVTAPLPGATVVLDTAALTATGIASAVDAPVSRTLDTASLTATGISIHPFSGLFISLSSTTITAAPVTISADAPISRTLDAAALTATGIPLAVVEEQFISLSTAVLTSTGIAITSITAAGNVRLDAAALTATGIGLSVDAPVTIAPDTASLTVTGIPLVVGGGARIVLDTASITATGINTVGVVQAYVVLDAAVLTATGIGLLPITFLSIITLNAKRRGVGLNAHPRSTGLNMGRRDADLHAKNSGS